MKIYLAILLLFNVILFVSSCRNWIYCADEGGRCNFSGDRDIAYGNHGRWTYRRMGNGADCNNGIFGDPLVGVVKKCFYCGD
jgi:hypothetical protein